mmetsp:Transcript_2519/g.8959  ORF Transcript_2519/g.8959 Transcript_2519/m.8959 type:complete len:212 (+) Transcript_2519:251-886(+)
MHPFPQRSLVVPGEVSPEARKVSAHPTCCRVLLEVERLVTVAREQYVPGEPCCLAHPCLDRPRRTHLRRRSLEPNLREGRRVLYACCTAPRGRTGHRVLRLSHSAGCRKVVLAFQRRADSATDTHHNCRNPMRVRPVLSVVARVYGHIAGLRGQLFNQGVRRQPIKTCTGVRCTQAIEIRSVRRVRHRDCLEATAAATLQARGGIPRTKGE